MQEPADQSNFDNHWRGDKNQDLSGKFDSNSTFETRTSIAIGSAKPGCRKGNLRLSGGCLNCGPSPNLLPGLARFFLSWVDSIG